jgi:putative ubiquitin-RnfH superfamily antitoxin RatB of RatAB toxin-antitoxin module
VVSVEVAFCAGPGQCDLVALTLPAGSAVADAVAASGLRERHGLPLTGLRLGVWSKPREEASLLRSGDRVEIYRALKVDPKEARRQRYQQHKESQARRLAAKAAAARP